MHIPNDVKNSKVTIINIQFSRRAIFLSIKRFMDIFIALIALLVTLPLMVVFGVLIILESNGSCFYSQTRVGKDGKLFTIYKLRSMYIDAEKGGPRWAQENDPRVTKIGRYIRKTRIDEIPQLINIIKGDMSMVGPRPERPYYIHKFNKEIPEYNHRLTIIPGLTGWAQVNGGYELSPREKLEKDLYYIKNQSIWLDFKIILKTIKIVLSGNGAR
ncbi:MAG: exopolysaccharide biosynthesis polyprenyl glycosylphosphotransferase [Lutispora sp.]|nr:exopolysaccharide biosynthesis polyprenyl glycosylphosphotransferase [Lutispora sp.]MDD4835057.1 exopolysaccharide biosynthesis polyprenyl glycosylphosphotransferase [Lutispora sp.]